MYISLLAPDASLFLFQLIVTSFHIGIIIFQFFVCH